MPLYTVIRGGGDLASGVAYRLAKIGARVLITELAQPLAVRRLVSFAQAVYNHEIEVEGLMARRVTNPAEIIECWNLNKIPVLVDPDCHILQTSPPSVLIDARMTKRSPELEYPAEWLNIGLGPGFLVGTNCDAAIETQRGFYMGRVFWQGSPEADTQMPESVDNRQIERVLRAPQAGIFEELASIGELVQAGEPIARVGDCTIQAKFPGILRGLIKGGLLVTQGMKIGDLDPRLDPRFSHLISDKALAVGGGVIEAILTIPRLREALWQPL